MMACILLVTIKEVLCKGCPLRSVLAGELVLMQMSMAEEAVQVAIATRVREAVRPAVIMARMWKIGIGLEYRGLWLTVVGGCDKPR